MRYEISDHSGHKVVRVGSGDFGVFVIKYVGHQSRIDIQLPKKYNGMDKVGPSPFAHLAFPDDAKEWAANITTAVIVARALDSANSDAQTLEVDE